MGDQVEMGDAAPVHVDEVMQEAPAMDGKEAAVVEGNANGHHVAEIVVEGQAVVEEAAPVVDHEGIVCVYVLFMFFVTSCVWTVVMF